MSQLRAYLQLVRLPAVFTAMADVFLGFLLTHRTLQPAGDFALLLVSSSCLYLAGMAFNDVFDREQDTRERPNRPIPSGRITVSAAVRLGAVLMLVGVGAAAAVSLACLAVAAALVVCILLYDGVVKATPLGPVAMGGCRFLNVMLAASAGGFAFEPPQLWVAGSLAVYVAGITWFARNEAAESRRLDLVAAAVVVNLGLAGVVATVLQAEWPVETQTTPTLFVFLVVAMTINRRLVRAVQTTAPSDVQASIRMMLLSIIVIDATLVLVATGSMPLGVATACLLVPALTVGRFVFVT